MTWAKLCDTFWSHPKILAVGNEGAGAFARMLSYSACHLTDGVIPAEVARTITTPRVIRALAEANLLEKLGENSWKIHGFLERNPSRSTVETGREKTALRVAEHRANKRSARACNAVTQAVTPTVTTPVGNAIGTGAPSRPVPEEQTHTREHTHAHEDADALPSMLSRASKGAVSSVATLEQSIALAARLGELGVVGAADVERFGAALAGGGLRRLAPWVKGDRTTVGYLLGNGARTLADLVAAWRAQSEPASASPKRDLEAEFRAARAAARAREEAARAAGGERP